MKKLLDDLDATLTELEPDDTGDGGCCDPNAVLEIVSAARTLITAFRKNNPVLPTKNEMQLMGLLRSSVVESCEFGDYSIKRKAKRKLPVKTDVQVRGTSDEPRA